MDSVSQFALGAAVGIATLGRRTALWKAALWGGVCGTLPDLDTFIDHGDPVRNMTLHRAESHALFWLTLAAPPIAALIASVHGELKQFRRWALAVWLALVTHPLLDFMTVYGTQLGLPFTDEPYGLGSIFIIDPLYTLPLLLGVGLALWGGAASALRWNAAGLALSTAYLAWSVAAQAQVASTARASLRAQGIEAEQLLVTPTPFNTLLWRVVAMQRGTYHEGFHSLLDKPGPLRFDRFERDDTLYQALKGQWAVDRMAAFSHGFFMLARDGEQVLLSDLRMGQEPTYFFTFVVAHRKGDGFVPTEPALSVGRRPDPQRVLPWLWRRALGEPLEPPR